MSALRATLALVLLALAPRAQQDEEVPERVEVVVTAASGRDVYLDGGREAGIEPGDEVRLFPLDGPSVLAVVRAVSRTTARAELRGEGTVDLGTRGEVLVPAERLRAAAGDGEGAEGTPSAPAPAPEGGGDGTGKGAPEHPPWTHPPESWSRDVPLLAPVSAREPAERDRRVHGRWRGSVDYTRENGATDVEFLNARTGLRLEAENPFGHAGRAELDVDGYHRYAHPEEGADESETQGTIERLSYTHGGIRGEPTRWQVGRFLLHEFPEFGIVDGVDVLRRFESGSRAGLSVGFLPEPNDRLTSGDDVQVSLYSRFVDGPEERLALGLGFQKTWHEGAPDRDLLVGNLAWTPSARARIFAGAWVDWYGSRDDAKDEGPELTQLQLNASYRWDAAGLSLFGSQVRFPQLLRDEFPDVTQQQLADERIRRVGLSSWVRPSRRTRVDGRFDVWEDEEDSGGSGDLRLTLRDLLWDGGSLYGGVFANEGDFTSARGARLGATHRLDPGLLRLDLVLTDYELDQGGESDLRQSAVLGYDTALGRGWDLSLFAEAELQDDEDALTLGVGLSKRF